MFNTSVTERLITGLNAELSPKDGSRAQHCKKALLMVAELCAAPWGVGPEAEGALKLHKLPRCCLRCILDLSLLAAASRLSSLSSTIQLLFLTVCLSRLPPQIPLRAAHRPPLTTRRFNSL